MTTTNAEEQLRSFIVAEFGHKLENPDFSADLDLLGEGVIDSMGVMQITTFLEEELGLTVEDSDIVPDNFRSLESLIGFVQSKSQGQTFIGGGGKARSGQRALHEGLRVIPRASLVANAKPNLSTVDNLNNGRRAATDSHQLKPLYFYNGTRNLTF